LRSLLLGEQLAQCGFSAVSGARRRTSTWPS